ncbi:MAG: hypothetical protein RJQ09_04615 [Cyclobacteriaceae bacterium]
MCKLFLKLFLIFSVPFSGYSQPELKVPPVFSLLQFENTIPPELLRTRTAVFIDFPDIKGETVIRGNWKQFAEKIHTELRRLGIDAIAYYHLNDFYAGIDATDGFKAPLAYREIENLIFVRQKENALGIEIELILTANSADDVLLRPNQKAYRITGSDFAQIALQFARDLYQAKLINQNFMVPDRPEFFTDTNVLNGRRYETFTRDLRIGKLAVPKFSVYKFPDGFDSTQLTANKLNAISLYNQQIARANQKLAEILEKYPYKYELVDYSVGEEHLYRLEFSHVLMHLHSTGINIRRFLNYEIDPSETDYITLKTILDGVTTLEQYSINTPVYKYYMKHLVNKEVYLGTQWDADLTWEEALVNHLNNFIEALEGENN